MQRTILSVAAVIAGAVAVAGCGASGPSTIAAVHHHTMDRGTFRASLHGFEAQLQSSVRAFQSGNLSKAASGAGLLTSCSSAVGRLSDQATKPVQRLAVSHLRIACLNVSKASNAGMAGHTALAKEFARTAVKQAQIAAHLSG